MKMIPFVSGSAALISCWLAATFFHQLQPGQYPAQPRSPAARIATPLPNTTTAALPAANSPLAAAR